MSSSRGDQQMIESLWAASERVHDAARRREVCVEWVDYHEHLAGVFRSHAKHHKEEQRRYQLMLLRLDNPDKGAA